MIGKSILHCIFPALHNPQIHKNNFFDLRNNKSRFLGIDSSEKSLTLLLYYINVSQSNKFEFQKTTVQFFGLGVAIWTAVLKM